MQMATMKRKELKFGSLTVDVRVLEEKSFPKNTTILSMLTEIMGHPVIANNSLAIKYYIYEKFMVMELMMCAFGEFNLRKYNDKRTRDAFELYYIAAAGLAREGWTRVANAGDKDYLQDTYVMVA